MSVADAKANLLALERSGRQASDGMAMQWLRDHAMQATAAALVAGVMVGLSPPARRFVMRHAWMLLDSLLA